MIKTHVTSALDGIHTMRVKTEHSVRPNGLINIRAWVVGGKNKFFQSDIFLCFEKDTEKSIDQLRSETIDHLKDILRIGVRVRLTYAAKQAMLWMEPANQLPA